jgi:hypothetical protein
VLASTIIQSRPAHLTIVRHYPVHVLISGVGEIASGVWQERSRACRQRIVRSPVQRTVWGQHVIHSHHEILGRLLLVSSAT